MVVEHLCIFISACVLFCGGLSFILVPFIRQKAYSNPMVFLSWITAGLMFALVIGTQIVYRFFGMETVPQEAEYIALLIGIGLILMPVFYRHALWQQVAFIFMLCFLGTFALTIPAENSAVFIRLALAAGWTFFILCYTELDRIPLTGYLLVIAPLLFFMFASTSTFKLISDDYFPLLTLLLVFILSILFIFKRFSYVWLSFPLVFVLTYFYGYLFSSIALMPRGSYLLFVFAYPLTECLIAIGMNLYFHRKIFPIEVLFLSEWALARGACVKKMFQRIFYTLILTSCIAVIGLHNRGNFIGVAFFMVGVLLFNFYAVSFNLLSKVSFKTLKNDAKMGLNVFWREMKSVPLKKGISSVGAEAVSTPAFGSNQVPYKTDTQALVSNPPRKQKKKPVSRKKKTPRTGRRS